MDRWNRFCNFSFSISPVNDAPTDIALSSLSIDENAIGAVVGTISSSDVDSTSATYTLSGDDAAFLKYLLMENLN